MHKIYLVLSLWFIMAFSTITIPDGSSYRIFQWSIMDFPQNFTIGISPSNLTYLLSPPMTNRASAMDFIEKYSSSVKGIIIVVLKLNNINWAHRKQWLISSSIPVGMVLIYDRPSLQNSTLSVIFNGWDGNEYSENVPLRLAFYSIELVLIFVCFIWCCLKIYKLIIKHEFVLTIGPVCLILELLNTFSRAIFTGLRYYFQLGPAYIDFAPEVLFLLTLSTLFTLSSGVFIFFFFLNLMSMKIFKAGMWNKAFWPSFVIVGIMFIIIVVLGIWNFVSKQESDYITYFCIVLFPILLILAILYFYTGYRVIKYSNTKTQSEDLIIIAKKIILSGICFFLIFMLSLASWKLPEGGSRQLVIVFLLDVTLSIRSFLQIDVFGTIKKKDNVVVEDKSSNNASSMTNIQRHINTESAVS